jgi:hypothetical protein
MDKVAPIEIKHIFSHCEDEAKRKRTFDGEFGSVIDESNVGRIVGEASGDLSSCAVDGGGDAVRPGDVSGFVTSIAWRADRDSELASDDAVVEVAAADDDDDDDVFDCERSGGSTVDGDSSVPDASDVDDAVNSVSRELGGGGCGCVDVNGTPLTLAVACTGTVATNAELCARRAAAAAAVVVVDVAAARRRCEQRRRRRSGRCRRLQRLVCVMMMRLVMRRRARAQRRSSATGEHRHHRRIEHRASPTVAADHRVRQAFGRHRHRALHIQR